ncbi:MAG: ribosome-associated translation inhibitor RaiA [Ferruginibacter sp.]
MQIIIQSPDVTITDALTKFINAKIGRLEHLYDRIEKAEVFLKIEKSGSDEVKVCEIRLVIPGNDLFVKKEEETFEAAVSKANDALRGEIDKMKTKFQNQQ